MLFEENNFNAGFEDERRRMQKPLPEEDVIDREEELEEKNTNALENTTHLELPTLQKQVVKELDEDEEMIINPYNFNVGKDTVKMINTNGLNKPKTLVRRPNFRMPVPGDQGFSAIAAITTLVAVGGIIVFYLLLKV